MEKNIYSNPEFFGLEIVAELSKDISYQFDQLVVLRNKKTNKHYIMQDSGCSCPIPFEDMTIETLEELGIKNIDSLPNRVNDWNETYSKVSLLECLTFIKKVKESIEGGK